MLLLLLKAAWIDIPHLDGELRPEVGLPPYREAQDIESSGGGRREAISGTHAHEYLEVLVALNGRTGGPVEDA